jgi:threonine synthase
MLYVTTRNKYDTYTAFKANQSDRGPDGGLYVPAMFPAVPPERLTSLIGMSYEERAVVILKRFLEDVRRHAV